MEEGNNVLVKHILLAKFKDDITPEREQQLIKGCADLVNHIEPMLAFKWGREMKLVNKHQGFTHVFESTFANEEGIKEYLAHPVHLEFAKEFVPAVEKAIVIDYKPGDVNL